MRAFIAIALPGEVKQALTVLVERLRGSGARATWVKPDAMHLTLRFLGDLDEAQVVRLRAHLSEGYAGLRAFTLKAEGLGAFPTRRRPAVVWVGVGPLEGPLAQVQAVAENAARAAGVPEERKPFHPHLTVARVKDPAQGALLASHAPWDEPLDAGSFTARGVTLFSSRLTPRGPIHERVEEYPFV